ncbi:MAG: DUF3313 domain-containing protein [Proteobacteria bacterium]|nr:DUF3313 domain-containing protein [Pseudomonadota bacterium]
MFIRQFGVAGLLIVVLAALLAATGCGGGPKGPVKAGFLGDYQNFQKDPENPSAMFFEKPGVKWDRYTKLMIDPVLIYYHPDSEAQMIQPDELKKLADGFRTVVVDEVKDKYPVVDKPGPDVLRIRAAIVDLIPSNAALNVVTTVLVLCPVDMGGAAMEVEFLDSVSNERLAAYTDRKRGHPAKFNGFTKWSHAEAAFKAWAEELRKALDTP